MLDEYLGRLALDTILIGIGWTATGAAAWMLLLSFRRGCDRNQAVRRLYRLCREEFRPGARPLQTTLTLRRPR